MAYGPRTHTTSTLTPTSRLYLPGVYKAYRRLITRLADHGQGHPLAHAEMNPV